MRLKRLELQGFKSFLDRTILTFEPGITGVVGPNGCGKSNIVDAIMWVMGEQSPKHLRGESMTDVIFAGSDSRAATSMAEVSLILDRQGVALAPQFGSFDKGDEIAVTRRLYRDGTSEFLINRSDCRLKDIHELFMDTGVGKRAYSIIEQGQIDRMINVKPEERRLIFEEVAGITKYKAKRKEAERKLEQTRENVARVTDIILELEKQLRSLKIQATRARKYRELKDELEKIDLFLLGRTLFKLQKAIAELTTRRDELVAQRAELDAALASRDAQVTELEVKRIDEEKAHEALGAAERNLALKVQKLAAELEVFEVRRQHLLTQNRGLEDDAAELATQLEAFLVDKDAKETERDRLGTALEELVADVGERKARLQELQGARQRAVSRKDGLTRRRDEAARESIQVETKLQGAELKDKEVAEAKARLTARIDEVLTATEGFRAALGAADGRVEDCGRRTEAVKADASACGSECEALSTRLSALEEKLFEVREEYHTRRSRLESLKELQESLEGYSPTAREILAKIEESGIQAIPLGEVFQPDAEVEEHLELLLGEAMNLLLVPTSDDAEKLVRLVEERGLERVKILALSDLDTPHIRKAVVDFLPAEKPVGALASAKAGLMALIGAGTGAGAAEFTEVPAAPVATPVEVAAEAPVAEAVPVGEPLLSRVRVKAGYEAAGRHFLGSVYLCPDTETLLIRRREAGGQTLLALSTKTAAHADHSLSGGKVPTKSGIFSRRREIEELIAESAALEAKVNEVAAEREAELVDLQVREKQQADLKDRLSELHVENVELRKEREKVQIEIGAAERDEAGLRREVERCDAQLEESRARVAGWVADRERLQAAIGEAGTELGAVEEELTRTAGEAEELSNEIHAKEIERSTQAERLSGIETALMRLESEVNSAKHRQSSIEAERERNDGELAGFEERTGRVRDEEAQAKQEQAETQIKLADTKAALDQTWERLQTCRDEQQTAQKKRDAALGEWQEVELKLASELASFEHQKGLAVERYQHEATLLDESATLAIEGLPMLAGEVGETWPTLSEGDRYILLQEHVKSLREKVGRYGEVNLTAIHEFDDVQKRFDFLTEQRTDLDNSIKILEDAILKIDESTRTRFTDTFEAVQRKFGEIFPILFGGGKGELVLTVPDNMLESGVDIMVQPPGKRLQSISLLSGGEKALTAVSLVLAIFARKPSPFCLLDEVDAPLDDANVSRFNTVIRKMAEKTQFIVITHNKKTMEIAEALYGVTMEKAGVSKMTSVRLN